MKRIAINNENYLYSYKCRTVFLLFTEKTTLLFENNKYTFDVALKLTKTQIKFFFSQYYHMNINKINTYHLVRQRLNVKNNTYTKKSYKRIIISLSQSDQLPNEFYNR